MENRVVKRWALARFGVRFCNADIHFFLRDGQKRIAREIVQGWSQQG